MQSNDLFYGPADGGIDLFDAKSRPIHGDLTGWVVLYDAGTEANQRPGIGPDQAPRQKTMNTGDSESKPVGAVKDGFSYPAVSSIVRLTLGQTP